MVLPGSSLKPARGEGLETRQAEGKALYGTGCRLPMPGTRVSGWFPPRRSAPLPRRSDPFTCLHRDGWRQGMRRNPAS